ncbi:PQQ-dependent sugar dehydrogenase [Microtetraspora malaysiensis]|uniref:PQQ-dependent sugar dehydrogenase n=1 Tax=Microtetraspora malaysiensis TaxID=161358 RepID=A0ABW6T2P7_9ACTN
MIFLASLATLAGFQLVVSGPASAATRYEAENATISQGVVEANHLNYSGTGFVNGDNVAGSYTQFTFNAPAAGTATLVLRYANGTGAARTADVAVNGTVVSAGRSFGATADWDTWANSTLTTNVNAGANTLRVTATSAGGNPNLDYLDVTVTVPSTVYQAEDATLSQAAVATNHTGYTGTGFVDYVNTVGGYIEWTINAASAGPATLTLRYANGTTTDRPMDIAVNGTTTGSRAYPATGNWDTWADDTVTANLNAGANTIRATATTAGGGPNVDKLTVTAAPGGDADGGVPSSITTISSGWTIPWGLSWLPDGQTALATERDDKVTAGQFKVFKVTLAGARTQVGTVPNVQTTGGEGGLLGVAVDPGWASNHYVYFFHTASEGNRIVRMTYNGTSLSGYTVLVQGIKKNKYHNGGRLAFGPDGYLYASTGDAQTSSLAQDTTSLNGKILRMKTDGTPAPGNPFGTLVYSYGHRNPQGLAFDRNGRLWEAEFGDSSFDELNLIKPGGNYGWPTCEGTCGVSGMTNPKATWPVSTASPSGIAIVRNVVYMGALRGERLWRIPITGDTENVGAATAYYVGAYGRLRTVVKVPGADQLWLTTTNTDNNGGAANGADKIFRVAIS